MPQRLFAALAASRLYSFSSPVAPAGQHESFPIESPELAVLYRLTDTAEVLQIRARQRRL